MFQKHWGIGATFLYGEGSKLDKGEPVLLEKLCQLEIMITKYDNDHIYIMDGQKNKKEQISLAVCCNASRTHEIPL